MSGEERKYFSGERLTEDELREEIAKEAPGAYLINNGAPPGLFVVENFLPPAICAQIIAASDTIKGHEGRVVSHGEDGALEKRLVDSRKVEDIPTGLLPMDIEMIVRTGYQQFACRHFGVELDWFETPMILRYREGGEYYAHADAYNWAPEEKVWRRAFNRDYSLLVYLNENYEGGEIEFKYLNFRIKPRQGLLLCFPSDWRYAHAALPVKSGVKLTIVSFATAKGTPRIDLPPPENMVRC